MKSLEDAPWTIRKHLNHEKRIHCPSLTMKQKEKQLEYACQYQTMSAKEWRKEIQLRQSR